MLRVTDVPETEILTFLIENQDSLEFSILNDQERDEPPSDDSTQLKMMFPESIRPNIFNKRQRFASCNRLVDSSSDSENESTAAKEYPRDLGSYRVVGSTVKKCNGKVVDSIEDSTSLLCDHVKLYRKFSEDGYLYFRQLLNRDEVYAAKSVIDSNLKKMGHISDTGEACSSSGWTVEVRNGVVINGKDDFAKSLDTNDLQNWKSIGSTTEVQSIVNSDRIKAVLSRLSRGKSEAENIESESRSFDPYYTWLRIKSPNEFTTEHSDIFYYKNFTKMFSTPGCTSEDDIHSLEKITSHEDDFGQVQADYDDDGSSEESVGGCSVCKSYAREDKILLCDECNKAYHMDTCIESPLEKAPRGEWFCGECSARPTLGTCWVPLEDVGVDHGVLALLPGSQYLPDYDVPFKASQLPNSYFYKSSISNKLVWRTGSYQAGDIIIFDSKVIHCTSRNYLSTYRLSLDFRWYLAPVSRPNYRYTNHSIFVRSRTRSFSLDESKTREVLAHATERQRKVKPRLNGKTGKADVSKKTNTEDTSVPDQLDKYVRENQGVTELYEKLIKFSEFLLESFANTENTVDDLEAESKSSAENSSEEEECSIIIPPFDPSYLSSEYRISDDESCTSKE